jgi:hypothetical protein
MKLLLQFACLFLTFNLSAEVDWVPQFNDKPVPNERIAAIEKAVPSKPIVPPREARRILVFSATSGYRHASIATAKLALEKLGKSTGAFIALISDHPKHFEPDALKEFDAVVLLSPTQDFFMPDKRTRKQFSQEEMAWLQNRHDRLVKNLVEYVKQGGGLVGIHAATDACYQCEEYGDMMGGYFDGHPWSANSNVTIVVEDGEHVLNQAVFGSDADFRIKDEIYQFAEKPYSREKLRILLTLDPERSDPVKGMKRKDNDYAVSWVQAVGEGRVFYSSIGHNHEMFQHPLILKHYLAGIQFATGDLEGDTTPSAKLFK